MTTVDTLKKDLHLASICIKELKQSKRDMIKFYQAEIKDLQDKIKELMTNAPNPTESGGDSGIS
jgi:hypothetical protein